MVCVLTGVSPTMDMHSSNAGSLYVCRTLNHVYEGIATIDANGKYYPVKKDMVDYASTMMEDNDYNLKDPATGHDIVSGRPFCITAENAVHLWQFVVYFLQETR